MLEEKAIKRLTAFKNLEIMYGNKLGITIDKVSLLQEDIETVLNTLKEKDKIIEAMAGYIAMGDIEEDICQDVKNDNCDKMSFGECESCIKQYFERKVREEK